MHRLQDLRARLPRHRHRNRRGGQGDQALRHALRHRRAAPTAPSAS
ncbi:MAG: hypothetical protein MZU79_00595 [Anaerotruncus sp.]|nr:hypothetical protein [Anaerotruncus sp.]